MRKLTYAIAMLVALVATGYAVADGIHGAKSATKVAGTFTATGTSTSSRTCTTDDGKTVVVTDGKYTGAASGDPDLTGNITLRARSVINTTDKVGLVTGSLKIDTSGKTTNADYSAVYDNGSISGLAVGRAHDHGVALVGNLSAGFDAATGFTSGKIGGGTSGGSAVEVGGKGCKSDRQPNEKSEARGTITSLGATITVAGLTCTVPSNVDVSKFKQGDFVAIRCSFANGQNTLTSISAKGSDGDGHKHK
ncbi:MAG TPA: hypothetical protein VGQ38_09090 [Gaiellaceae bacterium]|jgi:hypothetical protein|nr:hypothetical protein [Gaiellaceae bacterium]